MDVKSIFKSKTIIALTVMLVAAVCRHFKLGVSDAAVGDIAYLIVQAACLFVAFFGHVRASASQPTVLEFLGVLFQLAPQVEKVAADLKDALPTPAPGLLGTVATNVLGAFASPLPAQSDGAALAAAEALAAPAQPQGSGKPGIGGFIRVELLLKIVGLLAVLGLLAAVLAGCGLKNIGAMTGPEKARVTASELLLTWKDAYRTYQALEPQLSAEELKSARATVAPAINRAKPVVLALARAADIWSITAQANATGGQEVAAIATEARSMLDQVLVLINQIRR